MGPLQRRRQIIVDPDQLISGDLEWICGQPDVFDDISVLVSDPFGSAPAIVLRLPGGSPSTSSSMVASSAAESSNDGLDYADLLPESTSGDNSLPPDGLSGEGGGATLPPGNAGTELAGLSATSLGVDLNSEADQQLLAQT